MRSGRLRSGLSGSCLERRYQLLQPDLVGMMDEKMAPHLIHQCAILAWLPEDIEELVGDRYPIMKCQFTSRFTVDRFGMIGIEHDEGNRVSCKDLEVLRRQDFQITEERTLRHDVDAAFAHDAYDVSVRDGLPHLDAQPSQPRRVEPERQVEVQVLGAGRRRVPPGTDE